MVVFSRVRTFDFVGVLPAEEQKGARKRRAWKSKYEEEKDGELEMRSRAHEIGEREKGRPPHLVLPELSLW